MRNSIIAAPEMGDVIPKSGGIRKLRFARKGMGKRGGLRILYYLLRSDGAVILLTLYAKSEQENISERELKAWSDYLAVFKLPRLEE